MSKKDEFVKAFPAFGSDWREKVDLKQFVATLNARPELRSLFREAVAEAEEEKSNPAAGLATLFGVT